MNEQPQPEVKNETLTPRTVCGREMTTAISWYPHAEYQGQTIYFCTEYCLEALEADPERFYNAHSRKKDHRTED